MFVLSNACSILEPKLSYLNLTKLYIVPSWNSNMIVLALFMNELQKKHTIISHFGKSTLYQIGELLVS